MKRNASASAPEFTTDDLMAELDVAVGAPGVRQPGDVDARQYAQRHGISTDCARERMDRAAGWRSLLVWDAERRRNVRVWRRETA